MGAVHGDLTLAGLLHAAAVLPEDVLLLRHTDRPDGIAGPAADDRERPELLAGAGTAVGQSPEGPAQLVAHLHG